MQHSHTRRFSNIVEQQLCLETVALAEVIESKRGGFVTMLKGMVTIMLAMILSLSASVFCIIGHEYILGYIGIYIIVVREVVS